MQFLTHIAKGHCGRPRPAQVRRGNGGRGWHPAVAEDPETVRARPASATPAVGPVYAAGRPGAWETRGIVPRIRYETVRAALKKN